MPRLAKFEDGELMSIELLPEQHGHTVWVGGQLPAEIQEDLSKVLCRNAAPFARKREDMKGIDPKVTVHRLNIKTNAKPI